jgi:hypothetical protein
MKSRNKKEEPNDAYRSCIGRPSKFNAEIASRILSRLEEGEPLYQICCDRDMPDRSTVLRWVARFETFETAFARAREIQSHLLVDSAIEALETVSDADKLKLQKAHLLCQSRFALAEKFNPQEFGLRHLSHEDTIRMLEQRRTQETGE